MNEWKFQRRRKKRGEPCLFHGVDPQGNYFGGLCGCGSREPPPKKDKTRIIKRALARQLRKIIDGVD